MKNKLLTASLAGLMGIILSSPASAGMSVRSTFSDAALSIDGWGSQSTSSGFLQTDIPAGSTVLGAYLYSSAVWSSGVAGDVTLNGNFLSSASGLLLPTSNPVHTNIYDVTSFMKPAIESSAGGLQNWSISESGYTDGEVLVVAYKNAATIGGTAIIMDGGLSTTGDTTHLGFLAPYSGGDAIMSLASSYSYGDGQFTNVTVTTDSTLSRALTSAAGGNDDGGFEDANGALITVGGVGDSILNPSDPFLHGAAYDDELYNLALGNGVDPTPFLKTGDKFVDIFTQNPSNDDNVFGLFFTSTFRISNVDGTTIPVVPEPETYAMLLTGLGLLSFAARRRQQNV
ncbi:MAG: PEP-CTERM sorting domain-containing protein [Proteobacteria bacterium]|nr:PEP-CTERM sorting domain-containing protein [Pseudomonadota bacterium]